MAVDHALALDSGDAGKTIRRLYRYHNLAGGTHWRRLLDDPDNARAFLGLKGRCAWDRAFAFRAAEDSYWWHWTRRGPRPDAGQTCKLYISCLPADLPGTLHVAGQLLAAGDALGFKIGHTAYGVLRSDKLVAYFADREALRLVARQLEDTLRGVAAHGVPFTHQLDDEGLISEGADPPGPPAGTSGAQYSWRSWICASLGTWLAQARSRGDADPAATAIDNLVALGVDVDRWTLAAAGRKS